jgi:hypothetical protein
MRSNAHFSGLLKPLPSEAFSGWLGRGMRTQNPEPFRRAAGCLKALGVKDADGRLPQTVVEELSRLLGLSGESLRQSFPLPGDWLMAPPEGRLQFCEHCLLDDFCCGRHIFSCFFAYFSNLDSESGSIRGYRIACNVYYVKRQVMSWMFMCQPFVITGRKFSESGRKNL